MFNNLAGKGLALLGLLLAFGGYMATDAFSPPAAPATAPPNILVIVADDLGWADLNCYGNPLVESPNLDALARAGVQFMQGYAAAPVCSPSRASIQTGLHPARIGMTEHLHGYYDNPAWAVKPPRIPEGLDLDYETLGELAKRAGYRTAHVGKWHLGGEGYEPARQGYERTYAGGRYGLPKSFYYPFFDGQPFPDLLADSEEGDYLTDKLTDYAVKTVTEWKDSSWLLSLNYYAPHVPIEGRKDWVAHYRRVIDSTHYRRFPKIEYAAMVSTLDENVGRILATLRETGQLDNTFIVFLSDNGGLHVREVPGFDRHTPPTDNGILRAGKGYVYEGGIRVPFIVHYPPTTTSSLARTTPVTTNDIFPTVAGLLGVQANTPDGQSLLPILAEQPFADRSLYWHFPHYSPQGGTPMAAARRGDWKLVVDYETDSTRYFPLERYPDESIGIPDEPNGAAGLRSDLVNWKVLVGAREVAPRLTTND